MVKYSKALFITFEGCEGSGKSTQSKLLQKWFTKQRLSSVLTREPGGTNTAEKIRAILLNPDIKLETGSQLLLHFAARIEHFSDLIKPSLQQNTHVICDRFLDSTIAYQHYGHGLDLKLIHQLHKTLLENITPDITFVLDINIEKHTERLATRQRNEDRYESLHQEFHEKAIHGFKEIAKTNPTRCYLIDSSNSVTTTHNAILQKVVELLARITP